MNHPAELAMVSFLQKAMAGESTMTEEVADKVASDVKDALFKQFDSGPRDDFRLRMSNIGKPRCQLWFEKNEPKDKTPFPPHFLMNMILGDIVEAVFKGIMRASNVEFGDNDYVTLKLPNGVEIKGEYDMELDGKIDDVKSASPWSYQNKFASFDALATGDSFGYIPQLVGYAEGAGKEVGGWWVVNKANGEFKYVSASSVDKQAVLDDIEDLTNYINNDEPFEREFEAIEETFYRKKTGNTKLGVTCGFCAFKHKCWPTLRTIPSLVSKAKDKPMIDYVHIAKEAA
mgnify:FL=1